MVRRGLIIVKSIAGLNAHIPLSLSSMITVASFLLPIIVVLVSTASNDTTNISVPSRALSSLILNSTDFFVSFARKVIISLFLSM